jgi:hypothetical protein
MNERTSSRVLKPAVIAVMALFAVISLLAFLTTRASQRATRSLVDDMRQNDEVVDGIAHDLERKQLLVDRHIFEKEGADMREIEDRIAVLDADVHRDLATPLPADRTQPELRRVRDEMRGELVDLQGPIDEVLALWRANDDVDAHQRMLGLLPDFTHLQQQAARLVALSLRAAGDDTASIAARQGGALALFIALSVLGLGLSAAFLMWALRDVKAHDDAMWQMTTRLSEQNRELDAFAGRVAHDLRGPLTPSSSRGGPGWSSSFGTSSPSHGSTASRRTPPPIQPSSQRR